MYKTTITEIGELVSAFEEEQLVILFGPQATSELRSICIIHEASEEEKNVLEIGKKVRFGTQQYEIIEVGSAANDNFNELGHVSIYFREGVNEVLPGAIIVSPGNFPKLAIGDTIEIK
ncbi:PTS glucitol/sorbitol transporter subunit IIA [Enterococcus sp. BWB1-3]|uniref:PTS glucitol/sorbitol transporter subunit IIA n=1 Tax=unclassified Enterococcus TaxID=2608891 RepID=UPI001922C25B|nr:MULTISPECIES: PTS glucitol/sorbitol transporter subunit IIA [unclassified Enterococcus]MBL1229869.1 PTS glucitol/sorbitol transporter subunit IIA [Enterococcus sp. BWB1-3]MCB5951385.1 PTS glucitol/sorbitol transporter subunit IIA [Enterococcus sp. BWT-B8]MCB5954943.1 PTS glucitol/sorbitol transporter subunit IIA [Enterococcus sp. CWB-B31]